MLDEYQNLAVTHFMGPCLTIAGPGSGKTKCLVERVLYLIREKCVPPERILVITFTKAAASEMEARFQKEAASYAKRPYFGTFHALFFHILSQEMGYLPSDILTQGESFSIISLILKDGAKAQKFIPYADVIKEISYCKNSGIAYSDFSSKSLSEQFEAVALRYEKEKQRRKKIDFDDMMTKVYDLFSHQEDIRSKWQKAFDQILLDEMQDINPLQFSIIRLMLDERLNIFAVGDDDQSIYGFRGSAPRLMLDFEKEFLDTKKIVLKYNYRSARQIVSTASRLISHNHTRFSKEIEAKSQRMGKVYCRRFECEEEEGRFILGRLDDHAKKKERVAVLFRNKSDAVLLQLLLEQQQVRYFSKEDLLPKRFAFIIKDLLAYLKLGFEPCNQKALRQLTNKPIVDVSVIQKISAFAAANYIRKGVGYDGYLRGIYRDKPHILHTALSVCDAFQRKLKQYVDWKELWKEEEQLASLSWCRGHQTGDPKDADISLYTFHGSKGLEFDTVYILNVNEGIVPSSAKDADIEEERRMFYVAMTRAKLSLHVCSIKGRGGKVLHPSRFLNEMQE